MAMLSKLLDLVTNLTRRSPAAPTPPRSAPTPRSPKARASLKPRSGSGPKPVPKSGGIEFAYEPRDDGDADPGEVVWSWVEFEEDPTKGKDRPVVIVGYWGDDLCGVPLTSKARPGDPDRVLVGTGAWDSQRRPSYASLDRVLRVRRSAVRREGAALERDRFSTLVDALRART